MYYEVKYLFRFESANGKTREIRVLHREAGDRAILESSDDYLLTEHTGLFLIVKTYRETQRAQGRAPVIKKQQNGPIYGTSLTFYAECEVDQEYLSFYTSDPQEYRVDVYEGDTLLWQGFITPELYSEPDIAPPYDVQVVATDGLGELKFYDFTPQGTISLRAMLTYLLGYTGLSTDVNLVSSLCPGSNDAGELLDMTINLDYMEGETCYEVLSYILDTLHGTITRWGGSWLLVRETNVSITDGMLDYYDTTGTADQLVGSVATLGAMYSAPTWPVGQLSMNIIPAKKKVVVKAPWHQVTCLSNAQMTQDTGWTKYNGTSFINIPEACYTFPIASSGIPQITQQISMTGLRVPMTFKIKATGSLVESAGQIIPSCLLGALLVYKVGSTYYHLRKSSDGSPVWVEGSSVSGAVPDGTQFDFVYAPSCWDSPRIGAEEFSIENIPAFVKNGSFPSGTLYVYLVGMVIRVYSASLDVVLSKGYQDILSIDNGARGDGDDVEIAIGYEVADINYFKEFLQGLLLDSGSLITSFTDDNFTTGRDFLSFIARDYALSVALPRVSIKGTVYLEDTIAMPPVVFAKGGLDYWLQTWAWDLYEDELEIEAVTLPSAELTVSSEKIIESSDSNLR